MALLPSVSLYISITALQSAADLLNNSTWYITYSSAANKVTNIEFIITFQIAKIKQTHLSNWRHQPCLSLYISQTPSSEILLIYTGICRTLDHCIFHFAQQRCVMLSTYTENIEKNMTGYIETQNGCQIDGTACCVD